MSRERQVAVLDWSELAHLSLPWGSNGDVTQFPFPQVLLTRLLTYRNFQGFPFTVSAPPNLCAAIADKALIWLTKSGKYTLRRLSDCPPFSIRLLRERLLLPERSLPFPGKAETKYLAMGNGGKTWSLVNEVEHLTFGMIHSGLLSPDDFVNEYLPPEESVNPIGIENEHEPWVHSKGLGYLTSHPGRIGPGLEAQLLVHLPGISLARQLQQARNTLAATGIGFYPVTPNGSMESGLFWLKSSGGAGRSALATYQDLWANVERILKWEQEFQNRCLEQQPKKLEERVKASLETLKQASSLDYSQFLSLGSNIRLGAYLRLLDPKLCEILEVLRVTTGSGHLGVSSNRILAKEEEDKLRAKVVRLALEKILND